MHATRDRYRGRGRDRKTTCRNEYRDGERYGDRQTDRATAGEKPKGGEGNDRENRREREGTNRKNSDINKADRKQIQRQTWTERQEHTHKEKTQGGKQI